MTDDQRLFVDKVTKLEGSRFAKSVLAGDKIVLQSGGNLKEPAFVGLDEEALEAFILMGRLLQQRNDRIALCRIYETIEETLPPNDDLRLKCNGERWMLNDWLDSSAAIVDHEGTGYTNREIMEAFIYGEYAHNSRAEEIKVKKWKSGENTYYHFKLFFLMSLSLLFERAIRLRDALVELDARTQ